MLNFQVIYDYCKDESALTKKAVKTTGEINLRSICLSLKVFNLFVYLFNFGCAGSLLLCVGFL